MSFDLQQAIEEYCSRISVAQSQDEAIRRELASHLREKVDYYLNKRQLSEQEAFILASQAIGDASEFVTAFRQVHRAERVAGQGLGFVTIIGLVMVVHVAALEMYNLTIGLLAPMLASRGLGYETITGPLCFLIQIVYYLVALYIAWQYGRAVTGSATGRLARWIRSRSVLLALLALAVTSGVLISWLTSNPGLAFLTYIVITNTYTSYTSMHSWIVAVAIVRTYFVFSLIAYVACSLAFSGAKGRLDLLRFAFAPFVFFTLLTALIEVLDYPMFLARMHIAASPLDGEAYYYNMMHMVASSMVYMICLSGVASLTGWLVFSMRQRRTARLAP